MSAADTRRLYAWELTDLDRRHPRLPIDELRRVAARIWALFAPPHWPVPNVMAGRGTVYNGRLLSYCVGRSEIVLARHQRKVTTLCHELAHAVRNGEFNHGPGFTTLYLAMLAAAGAL